ncbi:MAG: hypothetical protein WC473_00625 [Patescibacteria group bacterium]|jgi:hypothetical protein
MRFDYEPEKKLFTITARLPKERNELEALSAVLKHGDICSLEWEAYDPRDLHSQTVTVGSVEFRCVIKGELEKRYGKAFVFLIAPSHSSTHYSDKVYMESRESFLSFIQLNGKCNRLSGKSDGLIFRWPGEQAKCFENCWVAANTLVFSIE